VVLPASCLLQDFGELVTAAGADARRVQLRDSKWAELGFWPDAKLLIVIQRLLHEAVTSQQELRVLLLMPAWLRPCLAPLLQVRLCCAQL
jgi:hypothetical protein